MPLPLPVIFLLPTQLTPTELHDLEASIPTLTYDINEAEVVLGRVSREQRAQFELRRLKLETEPIERGTARDDSAQSEGSDERHSKRRKLEAHAPTSKPDSSLVRVLSLSWLTESLEKGTLLPMSSYTVYEGRKSGRITSKLPNDSANLDKRIPKDVLTCTANDNTESGTLSNQRNKEKEKEIEKERGLMTDSSAAGVMARPGLIRQSTSEHDIHLPLTPSYLYTTYSCQRPTPMNPPNDAFIEELKNIRTLRLLQGDKIGIRAYSTSIASLAAYPYKIQTPQEVSRLAGCGSKIAELYQEWHATGQTEETRKSKEDTEIQVLRTFYNIWGVGDANAREFYQKGWRDLDDIVEYGWQSLSRVQQIGVKYYDDFQEKINREEVARIANIILNHARRLDHGYEMAVVGGYRRGRDENGDIDVLLTHREELKTFKLVERLVLSLESEKYISHTLSLSTRNSERGQVPLPWKGEGSTWGTGFDTLDKAMVVWLDPEEAHALHRRVDIIVSPWKTIGCAMLGWSGETTFQRDLRRYCKNEKGLKFDSSGIRNRGNGSWVDLECGDVSASCMEEAERRVFEGLNISWRPPWERCTG